MLETTALEVFLKLLLYIPRQIRAVRRQVCLERRVVFLDKLIEEGPLRAGFSESIAFIRDFKGWTGVTPYAYRKGL